MTNLNEYLDQKRQALGQVKAAAQASDYEPLQLRARVSAEGRSGIRRIRVRDFQVISDSPSSFAGDDLGPSSPELALGALGSCLTHSYLIQAAAHGLPVRSLEVEVSGRMDGRANTPGHEHVPVFPHDISYVVHIDSPADAEAVEQVRAAVERSCPILNLLRQPQAIIGRVQHAGAAPARSHDLVSAEGTP